MKNRSRVEARVERINGGKTVSTPHQKLRPPPRPGIPAGAGDGPKAAVLSRRPANAAPSSDPSSSSGETKKTASRLGTRSHRRQVSSSRSLLAVADVAVATEPKIFRRAAESRRIGGRLEEGNGAIRKSSHDQSDPSIAASARGGTPGPRRPPRVTQRFLLGKRKKFGRVRCGAQSESGAMASYFAYSSGKNRLLFLSSSSLLLLRVTISGDVCGLLCECA